MDELIERIENARSDADFWASKGDNDKAVVTLSLTDCDELAAFLTKAFGVVLMGKQDSGLADQLAILGGAFEGDDD